MITFEIKDMTCGHCVSTISSAIATIDHQAELIVDMARQRISVQSASATAAALQQALENAGYAATQITEVTEAEAYPGIPDMRSSCCH
ncbi:heavy-metal-associated domain-containing protein [Paraburkholderia bonniea]|uniref:heavy-metal-associated domain-containing protein n=1 Tax=Paraburkholderia bonniea TaxID=2152891 RepID=UPI0012928199|nr:heavy-metal-associated domain-containing protein [Paraburkholderia bonniea]WJF89070.1 heavy-metal-associated domain-containing protein [Paraburkholderia bonniea]WJF92386.1 heavy-metal-associated domain-containing protein [Paraburkholderia bonniea]